MKTEQAKRGIIAAALFSIKSGTVVPSAYEQLIADNYVQGFLTVHQSVELLEKYQRRNSSNSIK